MSDPMQRIEAALREDPLASSTEAFDIERILHAYKRWLDFLEKYPAIGEQFEAHVAGESYPPAGMRPCPHCTESGFPGWERI